MRYQLCFFILLTIAVFSCRNQPREAPLQTAPFQVEHEPFGMIGDDSINLYSLMNEAGFSVEIMNYGATIVSILAPDREGNLGDVVLGFSSLEGYLQEGNPYFGCIVGRYANRIANAQFDLNGTTYNLFANDNGNSLHGGDKGFDNVIWEAETSTTDTSAVLTLEYLSPDGEEGYPGNLSIKVTYEVTADNALWIHYLATTDQTTPVNLTSHSYFNLDPGSQSGILDHYLTLDAERYTPVDDALIPTGEIRDVDDGPMDFTTSKPVGREIDEVEGGYDHNFVLDVSGDGLALAATVYDMDSGRFMEMLTTEPAVQFYSGNFLDGKLTNKDGATISKHYGLCLEAQHFPDAPNRPEFPDVMLDPDETYTQTTVYRFTVN